LSAFSKYSPKKYLGQMMGIWFLASSLGGVLAGLLGGEATASGLESMSPAFTKLVYYCLGIAAVLIALSFFIKGVETPTTSRANRELFKGRTIKRFCGECNRTTKHTKNKVGSERDKLFTVTNIFMVGLTGGLFFIYYIFFSKTNFYDIFCTECNMGLRGVPEE